MSNNDFERNEEVIDLWRDDLQGISVTQALIKGFSEEDIEQNYLTEIDNWNE
jgi:hypothetical protein